MHEIDHELQTVVSSTGSSSMGLHLGKAQCSNLDGGTNTSTSQKEIDCEFKISVITFFSISNKLQNTEVRFSSSRHSPIAI